MINNKNLNLVCTFLENQTSSILINTKISPSRWDTWINDTVTKEFFNILMQIRLQKLTNIARFQTDKSSTLLKLYFKEQGGYETLGEIINIVNKELITQETEEK